MLDNSNNPIPGVTMRLLHITLGSSSNIPQQVATAVQTDTQGQFVMQPVPVGVFKLMADGGTAQRQRQREHEADPHLPQQAGEAAFGGTHGFTVGPAGTAARYISRSTAGARDER